MRYEYNCYRTHDGSLDIGFLFVELDNVRGYRAYILSDINYKRCSQSRSNSCLDIHRLTEKNETLANHVRAFKEEVSGRSVSADAPVHYICWTSTINSLDDMHDIAQAWSEITAYYIRYGGEFPDIQKKLKSRHIINI